MDVTKASDPKKVLIVITKSGWGGAQAYVYALARRFSADGLLVTVAFGGTGERGAPVGELAKRLAALGIRTIFLSSFARDIGGFSELRALAELRRAIRAERPDVLHLNSSKVGILGALAGRIEGVRRIVFTAHAWAFNEPRPSWQKGLLRLMHAATIILSHQTICVSESLRNDMASMPGLARKLSVVHNGLAEPVFKEQDAARTYLWPEKAGARWVGMLSELHPVKRIDDAIDCIRIVREKYPDTVLVVLGEGEERERLESLIRDQELSDAVRLAGFVPDGPSYLPAFDLFLHSSMSEALSFAVIEAGFAALPVIATHVGGIPEIVDENGNGLLVPAKDPHRAASALCTLIEDPARAKEYGQKLRMKVRESFSEKQMIRGTRSVYGF